MAGSDTLVLNDSNFGSEVLEAAGPVLVDFYADWCGPCRALAPVIDRIATAYKGRVRVAKLDVDASSKLTSAYDIRSIPTLVVFKNGRPVARIVGGAMPAQITQALDRVLADPIPRVAAP